MTHHVKVTNWHQKIKIVLHTVPLRSPIQHACWPTHPLDSRCQGLATTQQVARASVVADVPQPTQLESGNLGFCSLLSLGLG